MYTGETHRLLNIAPGAAAARLHSPFEARPDTDGSLPGDSIAGKLGPSGNSRGAPGGERAISAVRICRPTNPVGKVDYCKPERRPLRSAQQPLDAGNDLRLPTRFLCRGNDPEHPGRHPNGVGVHENHRCSNGYSCNHRRNVRPHARELLQSRNVRWHFASVFPNDHLSCITQLISSCREAGGSKHSSSCTTPGAGKGFRSREAVQGFRQNSGDLVRPGTTQEHLGHQDDPRVIRRSPRIIGGVTPMPSFKNPNAPSGLVHIHYGPMVRSATDPPDSGLLIRRRNPDDPWFRMIQVVPAAGTCLGGEAESGVTIPDHIELVSKFQTQVERFPSQRPDRWMH